MKVGDRVRVKTTGLTGAIESTVEDNGETFYNVRYDPGELKRKKGWPDVHVSVGLPAGELEPIPEPAQKRTRLHKRSAD